MSRDYQGPYYSLDDLRSVIDAMCKSIESSGLIDEHEHPSAYSALLDTSKWMADLEGQEPTAWMNAKRDMASFIHFHEDDLPLFARPVPVEPVNARLLEAIKRLSFCAQTTGGTAGRDEELCAAIGEAEKAIAAAEAQQDRLLQDMHDAGREIDRVMAEAAPKAVLLTDEDLVDLFQAWNTTYGTSYADLIRAAETAVLERNGLNPQAKGD